MDDIESKSSCDVEVSKLSNEMQEEYKSLSFKSATGNLNDKEILQAEKNFLNFCDVMIDSAIDLENQEGSQDYEVEDFNLQKHSLDLLKSLVFTNRNASKKFKPIYEAGLLKMIIQDSTRFATRPVTEDDYCKFLTAEESLKERYFNFNKQIYEFYKDLTPQDREKLQQEAITKSKIKTKARDDNKEESVQDISNKTLKQNDKENSKEEKIPSTIISLEDSQIYQEANTLDTADQLIQEFYADLDMIYDLHGNLYIPQKEESDQGYVDYIEIEEGSKVFFAYSSADCDKLKDQGYSPVIQIDY